MELRKARYLESIFMNNYLFFLVFKILTHSGFCLVVFWRKM